MRHFFSDELPARAFIHVKPNEGGSRWTSLLFAHFARVFAASTVRFAGPRPAASPRQKNTKPVEPALTLDHSSLLPPRQAGFSRPMDPAHIFLHDPV